MIFLTEKFQSKNLNKIIYISIIFILISIIFSMCLLFFMRSSLYFNQSHYDGAFQTLFPLLSIEQGHYPGRDFYFYHGNLLPYFLYVLFKIFRFFQVGHMQAALLSAFVANFLALYLFQFLIIWRLSGARVALIATVILNVLVEQLNMLSALFSASFFWSPVGLRTLPHLVAAFLVAMCIDRMRGQAATAKSLIWTSIAGGAASALYVIFSQEQGIYAAMAFHACLLLVGPFLLGLRRTGLMVLISLVSAALFLVLITFVLFGSFRTLTAIELIQENQIWIFGTFPNPFAGDWRAFFTLSIYDAFPPQLATVGGVATLAAMAGAFKLRMIDLRIFSFSLALFLGALFSWISNLAYIGPHPAPLFLRYTVISLCLLIPAITQICCDFALPRMRHMLMRRRPTGI